MSDATTTTTSPSVQLRAGHRIDIDRAHRIREMLFVFGVALETGDVGADAAASVVILAGELLDEAVLADYDAARAEESAVPQ